MATPTIFQPQKVFQDEQYDFPNGFAGGIDISVSPDRIAPNCSPDMENCNYDGGAVPSKRYGFDALNASAWGSQDVRGIFDFEYSTGNYKLLVAWNGKLYSVASNGAKTDLCTGTKASIADAQTSFFAFGSKAYFLTGTEYCYYDGTNPVANVVGYVPTITLGRTPTGGGTANEDLNYLSNSWKDSFSGTGAATTYTLSYIGLSATTVLVTVGGSALVEGTHFTVDRTAGTVNFAAGTSPHGAPASGTNNVVIQAEKAGLMDATKITACTHFEWFGGKEDTRVFVSGNPSVANAVYYSDLFDPTYFPENNFVLVGSDYDEVCGMGRVSDYLITIKKPKGIYYTDNEMAETGVTFPFLTMNTDYGCCSWRTVQPAQDGLLALSYDGVIFISPTTVRGQANVKMISKKINRGTDGTTGLLYETRANLEAAHAYVWRNKYFLHVNETTWVLDLDYSALAQEIYCWYPYTGIFASALEFAEGHDGLLYVGNDAGKVYKSNSAYNDATAAIDAWWTSPPVFGDRNYIKKFKRLNLSYGNEVSATHYLTFYTEEDAEDVTQSLEDSRLFDFDDIDFDAWTFGSTNYPEVVSEKINIKSWYLYWKIRNYTVDVGMRILSQSLIYSNIKEVK